jgi:hypothetical protein
MVSASLIVAFVAKPLQNHCKSLANCALYSSVEESGLVFGNWRSLISTQMANPWVL